jgi:hypothetical protein
MLFLAFDLYCESEILRDLNSQFNETELRDLRAYDQRIPGFQIPVCHRLSLLGTYPPVKQHRRGFGDAATGEEDLCSLTGEGTRNRSYN